jgi:hypothetical protein
MGASVTARLWHRSFLRSRNSPDHCRLAAELASGFAKIAAEPSHLSRGNPKPCRPLTVPSTLVVSTLRLTPKSVDRAVRRILVSRKPCSAPAATIGSKLVPSLAPWPNKQTAAIYSMQSSQIPK